MRDKAPWVVGLLLAVGVAAGLWGARTFLKPAAPPPGLSSVAPETPAPIPANLPPLDQSDPYVRERAAKLSDSPMLKKWLEADSLLQRLVSAMSQVAAGRAPRELFTAFAPKGKFTTLKKDGKTIVDPASYARYDAFAEMVARVDAAAAAHLFEEVLPLLDAAQRGLGEKNASAREACFNATREILGTPALEGDIPLVQGKKGIAWLYADEKLELLSPARKQLLRMGPGNRTIVLSKARAIALALGGSGF